MSENGAPSRHRFEGGVAALALMLVTFALLAESLFGGKVLTQADALLQFEPWASVAPEGYQPGNEVLLDQATGFLPWNDFMAEELRKGELPLWCLYNYAGIPLVGTYQSALDFPLNWTYFAAPSWQTYAWMAVVRLVLAGLFAFLFLRRVGVGGPAASVGAVGFMLCGFMVAWLNHPHANVALFLPAFLWAIERMAARSSWRNASLFGLLFGLQLLGGHVQTSLHIGLFAGCYALWRAAVPLCEVRLSRAGVVRLGIGSLIGVVLALPQLVPFVEYLGHSQAGATFDRADMVAGEGVGEAVVMMVSPDHYGAPHTHDYQGPLGPNLNYNELIGGYVGRILLLLALLQVTWLGWRGKLRGLMAFFALSIVIGGLVAWQVEPFYGVFRSAPVLSKTKLMRLLLLVAFGLTVLGAMGLDALLRRLPSSSMRIAVGSLAFVAVAGELLWFAHGYNPEVDPELVLPRTQTVEYLRRDQTPHRVLAIDNTVLKPNANVFHRIPMLSGYDSMEDQALTELLLRCTNQEPPYPFVSQIGAFNRIEAFGLFCLLGVKYVLANGPLPEPLRAVHEAELTIYENPQALPKAFLAREVRVIEDPAARVEHMTGVSFDPQVAIAHAPSADLDLLTEDPTGARAVWPERLGASPASARSVDVLRYEPREIRLRVEAPERALLVVTDLWDAGWHAEARGPDGSSPVRIERVDHALRGLFVEPGTWTVVLRYDPLSTRLALVAAAIALAALALLALLRVNRNQPA